MIINRLSRLFVILVITLFVPSKALSQNEMLIGLIPEENIFNQMERYRPLADYLSGKIGVKVKLTILSRYGSIVDSFVTRKMDGAFFGIFTGVLAMEKLGVEPVARPLNLDGKSTVNSYIFVKKDSGIKTVKDMRGKRIVFVDKLTATGYLFAIAFLREKGVQDIDKYFGEYFFTGSHGSAVYSVLDNRADIGSAKSKVFNRMVEKDPAIKDELNIIAKSDEFPDTTLCIRKDLPSEIKTKIKQVLLNMDRDPEGNEILKKFGALKFIDADKKDFQPFFELAKKAGINIKNYRYK